MFLLTQEKVDANVTIVNIQFVFGIVTIFFSLTGDVYILHLYNALIHGVLISIKYCRYE